MNVEITVNRQPSIPTLTVRRRSAVENLPATLGQAYGEIMHHAAKTGAGVVGPAFVVYYNMDMTDLDIEIGFVCDSKPQGNDAIISGEIPEGTYVTAMHMGPYSAMVPLYEAMSSFIAEKGLIPTGVAIEFYYNSPMEVQESELKTKILMRVND